MALALDSPVSALPQIRPADVGRLHRLGLLTLRDLLLDLPYGFETFQRKRIGELMPGDSAIVAGTLGKVGAKQFPRPLAEATLKDVSGSLSITWFNQPYLAKKLRTGQTIVVAGDVRRFGRMLQMTNPRFETLEDGAGQAAGIADLIPKYHLLQGLTLRRRNEWVEQVLPLAEQLEEVLPEQVRARQKLVPIAQAVRQGHRPAELSDWREATRRMAFAELFELQAAFITERARVQAEPATPVPYRQEVIEAFKAGLGFELTRAQKRAIWDVYRDIQRPVPMNRLLNGDVGSGKTAVAAAAVAMTHAAGLQSVVMAPTEILARQHLARFRSYLEGSFASLRVELLVSGQPAPERRRVLMAAASGHCALLVGTHALIEEAVQLPNLGLAVVDEQHRFGTRQREQLRAKGTGKPHFLAMTATPIPRTLALALYGDMAVSVIDELPPGRTPVATKVVTPEERGQAYELLRREVRAGHQAFVICPLVEESETSAARSATAEFDRLRRDVFPDLRLSLVHGRMKDKDAVMRDFASGESDVLVATAVVEVGVDVPNASVMLIEGAERFGLAQLHQFRGRVGRGPAQSQCLLFADDPGEKTLARLRLMTQTHDGFQLAMEDMRLRGAGELIGLRQHGMSDLAMQALLQPNLVSEARDEAERVLAQEPSLEAEPALRLRLEVIRERMKTG